MQHPDQVGELFAYEHLPEHLQKVSKPFCDLAYSIFFESEMCPETTIAIRKLWEAKNYAVWVAARMHEKPSG